VIFDTGSANLWVPDKTYCRAFDKTLESDPVRTVSSSSSSVSYLYPTSSHPLSSSYPISETTSEEMWMCNNDEFFHFNYFNSTASSSYVADGMKYHIYYLSGSSKGFLGTDVLGLGDANATYQLSVPNVTFGQATDMRQFIGDDVDGIFGLGFQSIAVNNVTPPIIAAIQQGLLAEPVFTAFLDNYEAAFDGGVFTFGALDTDNCGPVQGWANLTATGYWQFQIDGVRVPGKYRSNRTATVISDTGTSLIIGPSKQVGRIAKFVSASYWEDEKVFLISCTSNYTVTLTIAGQDYNLTEKTLTLGYGQKSSSYGDTAEAIGEEKDEDLSCTLAMLMDDTLQEDGFDWILGDPFIRQFCNVYDVGQQRIGFAPSKKMA